MKLWSIREKNLNCNGTLKLKETKGTLVPNFENQLQCLRCQLYKTELKKLFIYIMIYGTIYLVSGLIMSSSSSFALMTCIQYSYFFFFSIHVKFSWPTFLQYKKIMADPLNFYAILFKDIKKICKNYKIFKLLVTLIYYG